jgi:hypothetical protein
VVDDVHLSLPVFRQEGAAVRAVLVNKLLPEKRDRTMDYLRRALQDEGFALLPGLDWEPALSNPTLRGVSSLLELPLLGDRRGAARIIHHVQVGSAPPNRVVELLKESSLLVVSSNRDEILVTLAHVYQLPEYRPRIAGLLIPGLVHINPITQRILDLSRIPYLRTQRHTTAELLRIIYADVSKITAGDDEKLEMVWNLAQKSLDLDVIERMCGFPHA